MMRRAVNSGMMNWNFGKNKSLKNFATHSYGWKTSWSRSSVLYRSWVLAWEEEVVCRRPEWWLIWVNWPGREGRRVVSRDRIGHRRVAPCSTAVPN